MINQPSAPAPRVPSCFPENQTRFMMFTMAGNGAITSISRRGMALTGYNDDDIAGGIELSRFLEPLDNHRAFPERHEIGIQELYEPGEYFLICKNGDRVPVQAYFDAVPGNGKPDAIQGTVIQLSGELSEHEEAQEALRESEEQFSIAFHTNPSMMIIMSTVDARYIEVNESFCRGTGYAREELVGNSANDFHMWADESELKEMLESMMDKGQISAAEYRFVIKSGEIRTWLCSAHTMTIRGEQCILAVADDITERKEAEAELELMYETETGLREQLEEEMKRRAEFTRALVHELKTPLTPIAASSEVLAMILTAEPMKSMAENINRGARNLNKRIDELLELARSELNVLRIDPSNMDLRPLLRQINAEMLAMAIEHDQTLQLIMPDSLGIINADAVRIRQVMENLLTNALKYTPQGGTITISARIDGENVLVQVQDNGPGLSESEAERVFQPYYRKERDRDHLSGLGLGLALCKTLIDLHGGEIWVETEAGKGSTFSFTLPLAAY